MLDAVNYRAIEKLRDGRNYIIRAQRRDDNIIDALHQRAGLRSFYLRFLTRKHRLKNFEAAFYLNVDFIRQVALLADLHGEIIGGARYYIWSPGQADIAFIVGDAYQNKGHRLSDAASFGIHRPRCRYHRPSRAYLAGQSAGAARAR